VKRCEICGRALSINALALGWRWCWAFYCPTIMMDQEAESPRENEEMKEDYFFFLEPVLRKMRQR
jgi:hypothetical protein